MPIETIRDLAANLTLHVVTGTVDESDMYAALGGDGADSQTALVLWDMSNADVTHVTPEILRPFVKRAGELGAERRGGRTAVVAPGDLAYGLARMSEAWSELASSPFHLQAFRSQAEAMAWLNSDEAED